MASSAILIPTTTCVCVSSLCLSFSSTTRRRTVWRYSSSVISVDPKSSNFEFFKWVPQLGLRQFAQWNGLRNLPISTSQHLVKLKLERKGQRKGKGVYASLFGVGAPEALVIGVVALLVFGPKGLAEVARNLGKTLRAFQPTIKELQEVSREFKSTLEREIGIDEIQKSNWNTSNSTSTTSSPPLDAGSRASQPNIDPNGSPSPSKAYSSEELLKITEEQLKAAAVKQQEDGASPVDNQSETESLVVQQRVDESFGETQTDVQTQPQDSPQEAASGTPDPGKPERNT